MTSTPENRPTHIKVLGPENGGFGVNDSLTPKRRREARELGAAVNRLLVALRRRACDGDLQALVELRALDLVLAENMLIAAVTLNRKHGYSWADIGVGAGMSRQAAQQRWGRRS